MADRTRVAVIGGGAIGCAVLWELARRGINGVLLEAEPDLCEGTSKANGGIIHTGFDSRPGISGVRLLRGFYGGKAFLGSGGVHPVLGLTDYYPDEIRMRRVIINQAHECYVLADSSKLGRIAPAKVCDLDQVTAVITDDGVDDAVARDFERVGVKLLIAEVRRSPGAD